MNALKEFSFVGAPIWRLSNGKDLVCVELAFIRTNCKIRQEEGRNRRQPALSAGEWSCKPTTARRLMTTKTRSTPARRQPTPEETSPPAVQTLQPLTNSTIRHKRKPQTAEITSSPIIMRPTILPPSSNSPATKKKQESSRRSTRHDHLHSTSTSRWRMNTPFTISTTSRTSTPSYIRSS